MINLQIKKNEKKKHLLIHVLQIHDTSFVYIIKKYKFCITCKMFKSKIGIKRYEIQALFQNLKRRTYDAVLFTLFITDEKRR